MARFKNAAWDFATMPSGHIQSWEQAQIAVLMDIRDELQQLNALLACPNFTGIPHILRDIKKNTTKPRRKRR